jgi:hypothetical protein
MKRKVRIIAMSLLGAGIALSIPQQAARAGAQTPGSIIVGVVVDENKSPLAGSTVEILSVGRMFTDSTGAFRFATVPSGTLIVRATMIGRQPVMKLVTVSPGAQLRLDIALLPLTQQLPAVVVREDSSFSLLTDPTGFDERRKSTAGGGHYILAQDIAEKHITETEQLFHGIPTVQVDTGGIVVIKRGEISLRDIYLSGKDVNQFKMCIGAQVMVNGVAMPQPFNINTIPPFEIRGIEIYSGPATTPMPLRSPKTVCGTVAIWMKQK